MRSKQELLNSKTFCMLPWVHMHAYANGRVYPCCVGEYQQPLGNLRKNSMEEVWNQDPYKTMRKNMLNGHECKECTKCYEQEQHGSTSVRDYANENFAHHFDTVTETNYDGSLDNFKLRYWDVRFSNLCNMRCRTCGPEFSSNWYDDYVKINRNSNIARIEYTAGNEDSILEQMEPHIPYFEEVYFAGGEPLIMKEHYYLLDRLIELGKTDIRIRYNTNFSELRYKDKHVFDYWKKFENVNVQASLDATGARAELMRKGTDWGQIVQNRKQMLQEVPHVKFIINPTVSAMNVLHVLDFHREWVDQGLISQDDIVFIFCQSPDWYRPDVFPAKFKQEVIKPAYEQHINWLEHDHVKQTFKTLLSFIMQEGNNKINDFKNKTYLLDKIRKENFWATFPELENWNEL